MGFFKHLFKKPKNIFRSLAKVGRQATTITATGGLSLVSSRVRKAVNPYSAQLFPSSLSQAARIGIAVGTRNPSLLFPQKRQNMGFNLGGFLGGVGNILGNVQGANAGGIRAIGQLTSAVGAGFTRQPAIGGAARATQTSLRSYSQMRGAGSPAVTRVSTQSNTGGGLVPMNVAQAGMVLLGKLGIGVTDGRTFIPALKKALGSLASFARRTPAGSIVSVLLGLGLSELAANSLIAWYATKRRYRRINPANAKALRRAARRIKSFHRLCQHTDLIKTRSRSRGFSRCGTCRKSPCRC